MNTRITTSTPNDPAYITILRIHKIAEKYNTQAEFTTPHILTLTLNTICFTINITFNATTNQLTTEILPDPNFTTTKTTKTYNTFGALNDAINFLCDDE